MNRNRWANRGMRCLWSIGLSVVIVLPGAETQAQLSQTTSVDPFVSGKSQAENRPVVRAEPQTFSGSGFRPGSHPTQEPNRYLPQTRRSSAVSLKVDPINWNIVFAGNVLTGVGVAGFLLMAGGLAARHDAQERLSAVSSTSSLACIQRRRDKLQRQRNVGEVLALTGGISAAALLSTGLGLILGGRTREKQRREMSKVAGLTGRSSVTSSWFPAVHISLRRRQVDAMWNLRF